jgi:hypothetical protein
MEGRNKHIDQYFRQQLAEYTEMPPAAIWTALEERLDTKKRRRGFFWIWLLIGGFLAASGLGIFYTKSPVNNSIGQSVSTSQPVMQIDPGAQAGPVLKNKPLQAETTSSVKKIQLVQQREENADAHMPASTSQTIADAKAPLIVTDQEIPDSHVDAIPQVDQANEDTVQRNITLVELPAANSSDSKEETGNDLESYLALVPKAGKEPIHSTTVNTLIALPDTAIANPAPQGNTKKAPSAEESSPGLSNPPAKQTTKLRFTAGIKTGYEFGTQKYRANSIVISPYLQYFFTSKWGIMTQPAFKYSFTPDAVLLQEAYNKTVDSSITGLLPIIPSGNNPGTSTGKKIAYQKTYDSISIKHFLTNTHHWNVDLPLMLVYRMNKKLELYGGLNMHITRVARIGKQQQTVARITKTDTIEIDPSAGKIDTPALSSVIPNTGVAYSSYQGSAFNNPLINPFKMGVTFGASYAINKRLRFDVLYRQTLSRLNYIPNVQVREIYSQPYLRLTLGYKLTK